MVKLLLKVLPYTIFIRLYYNFFSHKKKKFFKGDSFKKFKNLESVDLKKFKTSSKIFIIGSGASLNNITKKQWEEINANDSFGFNFSFINKDHVPTFYACEAMAEINLNANGRSPIAEVFHSEYKKEKKRLENVPKILSDLEPKRLKHFLNYGSDIIDENLYLVNTINGLARTEKEFKELLIYYKRKGVFDEKNNVSKVFKFRATLSMALALCVNLGYKEVILCGIDLNDPSYFYQDKGKYPDTPFFRSSKDTSKHATILENDLFIPIDKVMQIMTDEILNTKEIKIYVQNPKSALINIFPIYKF